MPIGPMPGIGNIRIAPPAPSTYAAPTDMNMPDADDDTETIVVNPDTGTVTRRDPAGGMVIDFSPQSSKARVKPDKFDANLAVYMTDTELSMIASDIIEGVEADIRSRDDWVQMYTRGIDLLGLKIEEASSEVSPEGCISKIHHPLLLEAVIRFQSNSRSELLPSNGPVKVKDDEDEPAKGRSDMAEALEKDMNHYLTVTAKEYYPDFDRMLFALGLGGCSFRKIYRCPLRQRPVSESVHGKDLIVSNDATDLENAGRVTHRVMMRQSQVKRYQLKGAYRDVALVAPTEVTTQTDEKVKNIEGIAPKPDRPQDQRHEIYEVYTELDLGGFEHTKGNKKTGLPLPYRVTMDRESRVILEIRRDWKKIDPEFRKRRRFVKYGMIPGLGFYDYGFVHILGNTERSLTALTRELIDAGQFANFPAFLIGKNGQKQESNLFRLSPGTGKEIETNGLPIKDVIMELPYKEPSQVLASLMDKVAEDGRRLGMTAEINVGEGRADVPVGTIVAMIEQATKVMSAVHARMHTAQQEEFEILKELFAEDPSALSRFAKKPNHTWTTAEEFQDFNLVPASNPNVPSHIHRVMQATALVQLLAQAQGILNPKEIFERVFRVLNIEDIDSLFMPPAPPGATPPDPKIVAAQLRSADKKSDIDQKNMQQEREANQAVLEGHIRMQELNEESSDRAADRQSHERVAAMKLKSDMMKYMHSGIAAGRKDDLPAALPPAPAPKYQGIHPTH